MAFHSAGFKAPDSIPEQFRNTTFVAVIEELKGNPVMQNMTIVEVSVTDSLLAPSTQTTFKINDQIHTRPLKNLDLFAGKKIDIGIGRPILASMGHKAELVTQQIIYRISNRKPINDNLEAYNIHACDATLLTNSAQRVSKSWLCDPPSTVVRDILSKCIGAPRIDVETAGPSRPYIAENIHPFQAIAQQADVALYGGNDPCFLHYMSLFNGGTHHFRSLKTLTSASPSFEFVYRERGVTDNYSDPSTIMTYLFPCDFDLLSDIENGINQNGSENISFLSINPFNYVRTLVGAQLGSCGFGGALYDSGFTNQTTGPTDGTCEIKTEDYILRRQARLALLDQDKVALQIVVPFNPNVYSGCVIKCSFYDKSGTIPELDYGSGTYLVTTATHNIRTNGMGTTTLDCVSRGVGLSG
jgi:hypothetical protein